MTARGFPAAEVDVTDDLVRRLLDDQHPDLADRSLELVASGWDNFIYRLGDDLSVRIPRRSLAARLVDYERDWLVGLADELPIAIPAPVRTGRPALGYPWSWSITPWFDGEVAADVELTDTTAEAGRLGEFLRVLHRPAPDAPENPFRGFPVRQLEERVAANLDAIVGADGTFDAPRVLRRWRDLASAPEWTGEPLLLHGDLHAANVIVRDGRIAAIIDFGDISSGDPAGDLAVAWAMFDENDRSVLRATAGDVDDATWQRAEAWALHFGILFLLHSADSDRFARMGWGLLAACRAV